MFSRRLLCNRLQNRIYKKPLRMGTGCHCSTDLRHSQCSCFKSCRVWISAAFRSTLCRWSQDL